MRKFVWCNVEIDLDPHIDEGLAALPFIRKEAEGWFRDLMSADIDPREFRRGGIRITPAERVELGLDKWAGDGHISWEIWNALTDAARRDPARHFDELCDRIIGNARRYAKRQPDNALLKEGWLFVGARFLADLRDPCEVARATDGAIWTEIPEIPFGSCAKPVCGCHWTLLTERKLAREQGRPVPKTPAKIEIAPGLSLKLEIKRD